MSLRGQAEARTCDFVFAEFYTSAMPGLNLENLTRTIRKPVTVLSRRDLEEDAENKILSKAMSGKVAILVAGDPMVATTHVDLRLRAKKSGVTTRIVHGASVASAAAGATGLQSYKFGRTVTVPASPSKDLPESVYAALKVNFEAGLHSLILLEIDAEGGRQVTIRQAIERLLAYSARTAGRLITRETLLVGLARLEAPDMIVRASIAVDLMGIDFGRPPHCLILPSRLHFVEAEALQAFCGAPRGLVGANELNGFDEDAASRARKYITALRSALLKSKPRPVDTSVTAAGIQRVDDAIERYLRDAEHFLNAGRPATSLASVAYAEGLLDALTFLELTTNEVSQ